MSLNRHIIIRAFILMIPVGLLFAIGFNCAASKMVALGTSSSESSSLAKAEDLPYALLNAEQALSSMLNVTGQTQPSQAVRNEFTLRNSSFSVDSYLSSMNAPMLLSATSLAGEVCNSLLTQERALAANARVFFNDVNFGAGPSQIQGAQFASTLDRFSKKVWGRGLASDEADMFNGFYAEYMASLTPAETGQGAKTSAFYLAVCSAMLSSFESITF